MRDFIEQLYANTTDTEQLELLLGVIEAAEGITKEYNRDYILACERGERDYNELYGVLVEQGMLGLGIDPKFGGIGGGLTAQVLLADMLGQSGVASLAQTLTCFCMHPILKHGTDEQIKKYVSPTLEGKHTLAIMATEPNAGTNTFAIKTHAKKVDGKWILNGQKTFITQANEAKYGVVIARTEANQGGENRKQGISIFVMDMNAKGVDKQQLNVNISGDDKQFTVFMDDVELDDDALVGPEGKGMHCMFDMLNPERFMISAVTVGMSDFAINKTVDYVSERSPFGNPIGSYQAVQHPLAKGRIHIDAARQMLYQGTRVYDAGGDAGIYANAAKYLSSHYGVEACDAGIQFHGGYGLDDDYDILNIWKFLRLFRIAPINNEMVLNYVAEHRLGLPKSY